MAECEAVFVDAAISAVLSEIDSKSSLNEEQRTSLKAFLMGNDVFALHRSGEEQNRTSEISPQRIYELSIWCQVTNLLRHRGLMWIGL